MIDLCGRCLTSPNASLAFIARSRAGEEIGEYHVGQPRQIGRWVEQMGQADPDVRFDYGASSDVLLPVSTWYGDLVCSAHLWELTTAERR